jgi:hypothetical protein
MPHFHSFCRHNIVRIIEVGAMNAASSWPYMLARLGTVSTIRSDNIWISPQKKEVLAVVLYS